ncbi:unnamed protein product [Angiostrongylus costaricensis]|uniref:Secreted protein n=1 Tax=Angiostrongylus costaricensis TaxID=334426 RepID=A0A0R3P9Q4_ANGCS|nr:unnamed protein product [Angiostrongylus costaricensis]
MLFHIARAAHALVTAPFPTGWRYAYFHTVLCARVKGNAMRLAMDVERRARGEVVEKKPKKVHELPLCQAMELCKSALSSYNRAEAEDHQGSSKKSRRRRPRCVCCLQNTNFGIPWDLYYKTVAKIGHFTWSATSPGIPPPRLNTF